MTQTVDSQIRDRSSHASQNVTQSESNDLRALHQPAKGKVLEAKPGLVIFQPRGTNYELHLETAQDYTGPVNKPTQGVVHLRARKVYTVPSGGLFIAPILGTPRTVQGRVLALTQRQLVVHAGGPVLVDLPAEPHAVDLGNGPIEEGAMVNVVVLPGATFEPATE